MPRVTQLVHQSWVGITGVQIQGHGNQDSGTDHMSDPDVSRKNQFSPRASGLPPTGSFPCLPLLHGKPVLWEGRGCREPKTRGQGPGVWTVLGPAVLCGLEPLTLSEPVPRKMR